MQHCFSFRFAAMLQRAKKVGSDSLRLVDFAIGLENSVPQLPRGGGDSLMKQTGMLVGNFEFNP